MSDKHYIKTLPLYRLVDGLRVVMTLSRNFGVKNKDWGYDINTQDNTVDVWLADRDKAIIFKLTQEPDLDDVEEWGLFEL